MEQKLQAYIEI